MHEEKPRAACFFPARWSGRHPLSRQAPAREGRRGKHACARASSVLVVLVVVVYVQAVASPLGANRDFNKGTGGESCVADSLRPLGLPYISPWI